VFDKKKHIFINYTGICTIVIENVGF